MNKSYYQNDNFKSIREDYNDERIENAPGRGAVKKLTIEKMLDGFKEKGCPLTKGEIKPYIEGNNKLYSKDVLTAYREFFNTTTDYLLGYNDAPRFRNEPNIQQAMLTTKLSEESIKYLQNADENELYIINTIIENRFISGVKAAILEYYNNSFNGTLYIQRRDGKREELDSREQKEHLNNERKTFLHQIIDSLYLEINNDKSNPMRRLVLSPIIRGFAIEFVDSARTDEEKIHFMEIAREIINKAKKGIFDLDAEKVKKKLAKKGINLSNEQENNLIIIEGLPKKA